MALCVRRGLLTTDGLLWSLMDMIRTSASRLKAKLGQFMNLVRSGKPVMITDRGRPVAKLVPITDEPERPGALSITPRDPSSPPFGEAQVKPLKFRQTDSTALLFEERSKR